jgi:VanZ family protein
MRPAQATNRVIAIRLLAWLSLLALALLSWLPGELMIRLSLDGRIEHALAYTCATAFVALAYAGRIGLKPMAVLLMIYAGLLETGQIFMIERHAALWDFLASCSGIAIGCGVHTAVRSWAHRRRPIQHFLSSLAD